MFCLKPECTNTNTIIYYTEIVLDLPLSIILVHNMIKNFWHSIILSVILFPRLFNDYSTDLIALQFILNDNSKNIKSACIHELTTTTLHTSYKEA